ncbi:aminotransferase class IV [Rubripirellula amarantea]|nr:aminotransferase class IV [Rubripirellula amarantea]
MTSEQLPSDLAQYFAQHVCYFNGRWVERPDLRLSVDDIGFRQGVTAVERLRTYDGKLFAADDHLKRWVQTTASLKIDGLPCSSKLAEWLGELIERNRALLDQATDVGVTIFATPGEVGGNGPTIAMHLNPLDHDRNQRRRQGGQPLVTSAIESPSNACWPRTAKVRSRIHYYLADREARRHSSDALGVLSDHDGSVTETSIANLAVVRSGAVTSPLAEQVLSGITQSHCQALAVSMGIAWTQERISKQDLLSADEVLLMGTDTGVWFANEIDGVPIDGVPIGADASTGTVTSVATKAAVGGGKVEGSHAGPVCRRLQSAFAKLVCSTQN